MISETMFIVENVFGTILLVNFVSRAQPYLCHFLIQGSKVIKGIRALASHLDLSISTVSKALNGRFDINEETKKRVIEGALALGYVPNQSGRSLRQGATRTVGFMIEANQDGSTDSDNFFMSVFDGVQLVLAEHKLDLIVLPCPSNEDPVSYLKRMVTRGIVDAFIISSTRRRDPRVKLLGATKIPFVSLGCSNTAHPWVELDFEGVASQSVDRLVERGHRRIAVALPTIKLNLGNLFLKGYKKGLARHHIQFDQNLVIAIPSSEAGGSDLADQLVGLDQPPTAVLLSYELVAGGLYKRLYEIGKNPGRDIAVIGFRESLQTKALVPHLTCFSAKLKDIGVALAETLLSQMSPFSDQYSNRPKQKIWPMTLLEGDSDAMVLM